MRPTYAAFNESEHRQRLERARHVLLANGIAVCISVAPEHLYYFGGYDSWVSVNSPQALIFAADGGELRMQELAEQIGLNQSSVSRLVLRLEAAELTRRDHCPNDRRGVYTVITNEGRARLAGADATYEETLRDSLEQAAVNHQFHALVTALRNSDRNA